MNKLHKWLIITAAFAPTLALAQAERAPVRNLNDVINLIKKAIYIFQGLIFVIAVIMILIAAYKYVTAGGDSLKVTEANKLLIFAAIGIGVALLAFSVEYLVREFLGAGPARL